MFLTFSLANVLRTTTACNFSSLVWPAGSAPAAFSEPTFRPSGASNHCKNTVFRDFPTFSRICIFCLLTLSLLTLLTSAFQLSILSEVSLLNFLRSSTGHLPVLFNFLGQNPEVKPLKQKLASETIPGVNNAVVLRKKLN